MTTGATGQLGLALPVQGELSGTWGDTVNNGITQYTNIAIAGTLTLTGDGAVTLTNTTGDASASNITSSLTGAGTVTAQFAIVKIAGTLTTTKVVTFGSAGSAPYSKTFMVVNAATGGTVTFKAYGQTGVSIAVGETAFVYYNGTDIVKVVGTATAGAAGGSNTQVQYNSSGALAGSSALTFDGTNLSTSGYYIGTAATGRLTKSNTTGRNVFTGGITGGTTDGAYIITEGYDYGGTAAGGAINLVTAGASSPVTFAINGSEQMRLTSTGLGIGTTPSYRLQANFTEPATTSRNGFYMNTSATNSDVALWRTGPTHSYAGVGASQWWLYHYNSLAIGSDSASAVITFVTNATERARIDSSGNVLVGGTAARGTTAGTAHLDLFNGTAPAGTLTNGVSLYSSSGDLKFMNAAGDGFDVGYRNIPQNSQSAAYTTVLADAGKCIYHPTTDANARTFTIASNASVPYPIGTVIQFVNMTSQVVTIAINSDTMYLAGTGTTGSRSLAIYGVANAMKMTSTTWIITGSGLT